MTDSMSTTREATGEPETFAVSDAMKPKYVRCPLGYEVYRSDDYYVGLVYPIEMASHIRRGRSQTSPWWMAQMPDGTQVTGPDPYRHGRTVDRWQRRIDAADRLVESSRIAALR